MRICLWLLLFTVLGYAESAGRVCTLDELVDSAYRHSGAVKNSDIELEQSYVKTKEVRSSLFPHLGISGGVSRYLHSYDRYQNESSLSFQQKYSENMGSGLERYGDMVLAELLDEYESQRSMAPKKYQAEIGLHAQQPISLQGRGRTSLKISKVESSMLVCRWQDARMKVKADVARLYFALQKAESELRIMNEILRFAEEKHRLASVQFAAGALLPLDTLSTFLDAAESEERVFRAKQSVSYAELALRQASGISDSVIAADELTMLSYEISYDSALTQMLQLNKSITSLRGEEELAGLRTEYARQAYFPKAQIGADLYRMAHFNESRNFSFDPERRVYLNFQYDVTTSGKRWFALLQARQNELIASNKIEDRIAELTVSLKQIWQERDLLKARIERIAKNAEAAEFGRRSALQQYRSGAVSVSVLNDFLEKYCEAQLLYADAVFQYNCTIVDIRLLTADYLYK